jgi:hypothetical protein
VTAIFEFVKAAVRDDEHFLGTVLDIGLGYAQASQVAPHEIDVRVINGAKRAVS